MRAGHEDDMVIELANEVRKVLGIVGTEILIGKTLAMQSRMAAKSKLPVLQLHPLPEPVGVAMDS